MIITLTTDFSDKGGFVAQLKAEIIRLFGEDITIIDITHTITPFRALEAAYTTRTTIPSFEEGSIHIVVVDPGVGTDRDIVAIEYNNRYIISPDNEALSLIEPSKIIRIDKNRVNPNSSSTFEARDIMVKAAYMLKSNGIDSLGEEKSSLEHSLKPKISKNKVKGKIIYIDNFGNCISNINSDLISDGFEKIVLKNIIFRHLEKTYHSPTSSYKALINSSGFLEFAYFKKNFAEEFGVDYLDDVEVYL
ncbi:SAM hydrolase/SAM-dependent halogenase family protein [Hippea sp. KM1]|uniref:SAM hydrolase/SAM-dependent halogenase family protein n=1 Tax=Hippea sp. KM1 TaxID=944481 RepID=UPI00046CD427|nr:SAM-dependent chlorinase/fluorinase [Hippea sp. KM1]